MMLFFRERQAFATWVLAALAGIGLALFLGIIRYTNFGVSVNDQSYGWSRVGFGANGELATIGLVALVYIGLRIVMGLVGTRSYR